MGRGAKIGIVIGGYVVAIGVAMLAGWLYDAHMARMPYDTSGGMYAEGETLTALPVFFLVALVPTLLGLWFLRRHTGFWNLVAIGSLAFAAVSLAAVLVAVKLGGPTANLGLVFLSLLGLAQLLGMPLFFLAFVLFSVLAPTPLARRRLRIAVAIEAVIGVCALLHWFVPAARF
jgi:hypothetical protein